jgi:hypothetical protein
LPRSSYPVQKEPVATTWHELVTSDNRYGTQNPTPIARCKTNIKQGKPILLRLSSKVKNNKNGGIFPFGMRKKLV